MTNPLRNASTRAIVLGMPTDEPEELVTAEVCKLLNIDRTTVTRWVQAGKLTPARKLPGVSGAYLYKRADIDAMLERRAS